MADKPLRAFLTGSYAYGKPRVDSDIDLVVFIADYTELQELEKQADAVMQIDNEYENADAISLRFGKLNLIVTTDEADWEGWKKGTFDLKRRKPVTRKEAIKYMADMRANYNRS
jgi:predicted nucleotidyltransferase